MTVTVYVPADSAAKSVGAGEVAAAIAAEATKRHLDIRLVRNGSRGLLWLEPLVEVETVEGRVGYGPVTAVDVAALFDSDFLTGAASAYSVGLVDEIPWLADQQRVTFARVGVIDPLDIKDYEAHGGLAGLRTAIALDQSAIVEEVLASGLRGRGGAGFPAGIKWRTVMETSADQKYVCCNADEGDSGTFADRMLMEGDPFTLIEGMTIAGIAGGATKGLIYIRSEYPDAIATMRAALLIARDFGLLGDDVLGSGNAFDISVRVGAGSYVCGEETAMLESLEGKRGMVRAKPPIPALHGLFGAPTIVNNVLTLGTVPMILAQGAAAYQALGADRSRGTQVFQLAGNIARGGIVERAFGISLQELVESYGGGTRSGRPVRSVQVGGPLGAYFPAGALDVAMDYEALIAAGGMLGHGGIVVFDDSVDMAQQARFAMEFCAKESCGKCTPCRVGSVRGTEVIDKIVNNIDRTENLELLNDLCDLMTDGSLCAMGGLTPMPVLSALRQFPEDFQR
jgi:formate dehydrogenase iron-sulfur subunit